MKKIENALVILAGGIGTRFGKQLPKQFTQINVLFLHIKVV